MHAYILAMEFSTEVISSNLYNSLSLTLKGKYLMLKVAKTILFFIKFSVAVFLRWIVHLSFNLIQFAYNWYNSSLLKLSMQKYYTEKFNLPTTCTVLLSYSCKSKDEFNFSKVAIGRNWQTLQSRELSLLLSAFDHTLHYLIILYITSS